VEQQRPALEVSFEVSGFSGFFVKTSNAPLPVSWISLSARRDDTSRAVLDWRLMKGRYRITRWKEA